MYSRQTSSPPGTCVLLPCPVLSGGSTIQNFGQLIDHTEDNLSVAEPEEDVVEPPRKRTRKSKSRVSTKLPPDVVSVKELFLQHPAEFWELFETTRKIMEFLRGEEGPSTSFCVSSSEADCDASVSKFLEEIKLSKHKSVFSRSSASTDISTATKIFVREMCTAVEEDPMYQMILLRSRTKEEFTSIMEKKGMFDTAGIERYCVPGPGGINVEVSDEVVASWKDETVFQININKGVCRLEPAVNKRSSKVTNACRS
ncbi:hypothetical protein Aduo_003794 [Ancylostoma duodenale]